MSGSEFAVTLIESNIMVVKTFPYYKWLAMISLVLLGFMAGMKGVARADAPNQEALIVSQNEAPATSGDTNAPSSQGKESETQPDEKKESAETEKKPLKDFRPSEQIEADQAVDFPYDI